MAGAALTVTVWQPGGPLPAAVDGLWLAAVETPPGTQRDPARLMVRQLLREMLGRLCACPPDAIALSSVPGQPLCVEGRPGIGLSVSHEPGLSLAAINPAGPVGIDLLALTGQAAWRDDIPLLARDYLGPDSAARLAGLPAGERPQAFAAAWTAHEAGLKCLGMGIGEWNPAQHRRLAACTLQPLALPAGYVGSVARLA